MPLNEVLRDHFPWCAGRVSQLGELFGAYVEAKQPQSVLDYDDLLLCWAQTASDPMLAGDIGARLDHVLAGEYQDTTGSNSQYSWD